MMLQRSSRETLPKGGSVIVPAPWRVERDRSTYADRASDILIAYRNWRPMMSGHPECDGMIAAARSHAELRNFRNEASGALSIQWSAAREIPGQRWDGNEKLYPIEANADGSELTGQLAVHTVGWLGVYDRPAWMLAQRTGGLDIAMWILESHGGLARARRIIARIAESYVGN